MQKKLTLLILMVFSLNIYTQVVIKDEIDLDAEKFEMLQTESASPDSLWLRMPFYGKVREEIYSYSIVCGNSRTDLIVDGIHYPFGKCYYMNCGQENCFCSSGYRYKEISNVPMGKSVDTKLQRCWIWNGSGNSPSWGVLEHYFQLISGTATEWKYEVKARMTINHPWQHAAYIYLTKTTPPPCCPLTDGPCAPLCEQPFAPPDTNIYRIPDASRCNEPVKDIPAGVFTPHYWGLGNGEEIIVTPCQDPMTGNIKFKFATNQRNSIDLPYNLELCPDRIAYLNLTRIDSEEEFEDYLIHNVSNQNDACTLRQLILNHKGLDPQGNQTGGEILSQNGIWITASTLAHEYEHERDYEKALKEKIHIFYEYYENYSIDCSTYSPDTENAKTIAIGNFKAELTEFSIAARNYYESNLDEVELNGRPEVQSAIEPYLTMLDTFIRVRFGFKILEEIKRYCK